MQDRTFLFITANDNEFIAFREKFTIEKTESFGHGFNCTFGKFGNYKVWHYHLSVHGVKVQVEIMNIIEFIKPDAIILVGIAAGGYNQKLGDVLVSEKIIYYDFPNIKGTINPRDEVFTCGEVLYQLFKSSDNHFELQNDNKVHFGEMFSFSQLLNSAKNKKEVFASRNYKAIGHEMEGFIVARACRDKNISQWIIVKGVCNIDDGTKDVDWQLQAAQNAVSYCHYVFLQLVYLCEQALVLLYHSYQEQQSLIRF